MACMSGQIHKIMDMYRDVGVVDQLARCIGRVKEVQLAPKLYYVGDYVKVRTREKPIKN